jgi:hypothetical protein
MKVQIDLATTADDAAIRGLCRREAMPGRISLTYEREPEFSLGCRVTGQDVQVVVAREEKERIVGVACRSTREMFINGMQERLGYLGQLRIDQNFRGRWLVSKGFSLLRELHEQDPVPAYLVSVVAGNREAEGVLIHKARRCFPLFHPVADIRSFAIPLGPRKPLLHGDLELCWAKEDEAEEIVQFLRSYGRQRQFFPVWTTDRLCKMTQLGLRLEDILVARRNGKTVGIAGLWDQSPYKQTVVQGYSGLMRAAAPLYNLSAQWLGRPTLPSIGAKLHCVYATFVCIPNNDIQVFAAQLRELYTRGCERGWDYLLLGLDSRDPFLPVARKYAHILYPSRLYLVEWPDGGKLHERLDHRTAYVDIATL